MTKNGRLNESYCPIDSAKIEKHESNVLPKNTTDQSSIFSQIREQLHHLKQQIFGSDKETTQVLQNSKLNLDDLRIKNLPPIIQKHLLARQQIMNSCIESVELDEAMVTLEDPRGNLYQVKIDYTTKFQTTQIKEEIQQVRKLETGHTLTFDSIGGKNGYNTEYRVTAKKGNTTETWNLLAVRFGKMSNIFYQKLLPLEQNARIIQKEINAINGEIEAKEKQVKDFLNEQVVLQERLHPSLGLKKSAINKKKAKKESSVTLAKRLRTIEKAIPELRAQVYRHEKEGATLLVSQKENQTQMDRLLKMPGMKANSAFIPFANIRESSPSKMSKRTTEKIASEVERYGLLHIKESVSRAWTARDIVKTETSLKDARGNILSLKEAFPIQAGIVLAIVERMGFVEYAKTYNPETRQGKLKSRDQIEPLMDEQIIRALYSLGMNGEGAFNNTRSSVGARGIAQMMPQAHRDFVNKYGTKSDGLLGQDRFDQRFIHASTTPSDSLRFMLIHLYDEARYFPVEIRDNWQLLLSKPKTRSGILGLLAAGYNGDITRVKAEVGIPSGIGSMRESLKMSNNPKKKGKLSRTYTRAMEAGHEVTPEAIVKQLEYRLDGTHMIEQLEGNIETSTYVMKFEYVWNYLQKHFPNEFGVKP